MSQIFEVRKGPIFYGVAGTTVLAVLLAIAVAAPRVVFHLSTDHYVAEFAGAAGVAPGDEVHVAGVPAGKITSVTLAGDRVRIGFRLDENQRLHENATASVKVATVLGKRYVGVDPGTGNALAPDSTIPLKNTSVPYSLGKLAKDADKTISELDLSALRSAMDTLRGTTQDPKLVSKTLSGITGLARMVNERGAQLDQLLAATKSVTSDVLSQRRTLVKLLGDAETITSIINDRRQTINKLISDVHSVSEILRRILRDTDGTLGPLLSDLHALTDSLEQRNEAIGKTLKQLAPGSRYLANATGNGPWGDVSGPAGPIPDNLLCVAGLLQGCR